jgi:hypothetical protein
MQKRYKCIIWLVALSLMVVACNSKPVESMSFSEQWKHYKWRLPEGGDLPNSPLWNAQMTRFLNVGGCPGYLAEYISRSSDILEASHVFPYQKFHLTDRCVAHLAVFTRYYLEKKQDQIDSPNYVLDLSYNEALTNASVAYLIEALREDQKIQWIDLSHNPKISLDAIAALEEQAGVKVIHSLSKGS